MEDETAISEITIAPDGRVYVFGASREVLEVLALLNDRDAALRQRLEQVGRLQQPARPSATRAGRGESL